MANKRVTDLDPIATAPTSGVMHFIDTTDSTQNAAGSSFKVTKEDFLKENTAAILLNTAKIGITNTQANDIEVNNSKIGITTTQVNAITNNTNKISFDSTSSTRLENTSGTNTGDQNLSTFTKFLQVANYAALTALSTTSNLTIVKVLNDEDKGITNATYHLYPDGVRMWVASTQDN